MASRRRTGRDVLAMDRGTPRLLADAFYLVASTFLCSAIRKEEKSFSQTIIDRLLDEDGREQNAN